MPTFDAKIWKEIAPRFRELRGKQSVDDFLGRNDKEDAKNDKQGITGLHWNAMEAGRTGISCESLFRLCQKKNASPTGLMFGIEPRTLKECKEQFLNSASAHKELLEEVIDDFHDATSKSQNPKEAKRDVRRRVRKI